MTGYARLIVSEDLILLRVIPTKDRAETISIELSPGSLAMLLEDCATAARDVIQRQGK